MRETKVTIETEHEGDTLHLSLQHNLKDTNRVSLRRAGRGTRPQELFLPPPCVILHQYCLEHLKVSHSARHNSPPCKMKPCMQCLIDECVCLCITEFSMYRGERAASSGAGPNTGIIPNYPVFRITPIYLQSSSVARQQQS